MADCAAARPKVSKVFVAICSDRYPIRPDRVFALDFASNTADPRYDAKNLSSASPVPEENASEGKAERTVIRQDGPPCLVWGMRAGHWKCKHLTKAESPIAPGQFAETMALCQKKSNFKIAALSFQIVFGAVRLTP